MPTVKKHHLKKMKSSIKKIYPYADVTFINGSGKHYQKILVEVDGQRIKAPIPSTPGDRNWFKSAIRQIVNNLKRLNYPRHEWGE